jgi:site-specific DNA-methyltransferase (cytosine-N4-specific)
MKPYYETENGKLYCGDILEIMKFLPDKSINAVITSPPYWQLRDYGYPEQWGLESTFQEYLEHLWQMMDEVYRVLKDDGTCWINLGDTYARGTRGKDGTNHTVMKKSKEHHIEPLTKPDYDGRDKCLLLIPHRFAIECINNGWIVRNDIIWAKRNGMPEPVNDRFAKKHEYFFFMVKSQKYYFDLESIRDKCKPLNRWGGKKLIAKGVSEWDKGSKQNSYRSRDMQPNNGMKNPGDVSDFWDIPTKPSSKKHYATYNFDLIDKCIIAGCPKGGTILDPFNGSGTTTLRAEQLDRKWIGIDGSEEYSKIAKEAIENERVQLKLKFIGGYYA